MDNQAPKKEHLMKSGIASNQYAVFYFIGADFG
jgi:hypothetical protein